MISLHLIVLLVMLEVCYAATKPLPVGQTTREGKNLAYFDYSVPLEEYGAYDLENDYVIPLDETNDLSRTVPTRKRLRPQPYNSPIYYIRLPPQPYMFVPGLGYVSQPQQTSAMSQFVNLPLSFVSNGKPNQIYQWGAAYPSALPPTTTTPKPVKKPVADSTVHRLPGQFTFNGKPEEIFVLRDSYNSLYGDALQNFYP